MQIAYFWNIVIATFFNYGAFRRLTIFHVFTYYSFFFSLSYALTLTWQLARLFFFFSFFTRTSLANTLASSHHSSTRCTHTSALSPTHIIYTSTSLLLSNIILRCHALTYLSFSLLRLLFYVFIYFVCVILCTFYCIYIIICILKSHQMHFNCF